MDQHILAIAAVYRNRADIDERPEIVNTRERVGDWEADTIIGKNHKGVFVTLDERKSKLRLAWSLPVSKELSGDAARLSCAVKYTRK